MAVDTPTSYKDPYWTSLASNVETKLDLPKGLLVGVLTRGERSNADQVSEAGAKTPFQIIPATRKAAIDKYGIDPYLSPENAADVAGKLLKDSLDRNKGDAAAAVGEYVGGTDRANWGPTTRAYVKRVVGAAPADSTPTASSAATPAATGVPQPDANAPAADAGPSTFDKLWSAANAPPASQIANVLKAYQSGQMAPDDAKQFEADVNAGHIMLPKGATLAAPAAGPTSAAAAPGAPALPLGVVDAFDQGKITGKDRDQLLADVAAGHVAAPDGSPLQLQALHPNRDYKTAQIPGAAVLKDEQGRPYIDTTPNAPTTIGDRLAGAGEAALSAITGTVGYGTALASGASDVSKTVSNVLAQKLGIGGQPVPVGDIEANANAAGQALTYQPRTDTGQQYAQNLGEAMQPLAGMAPAEAAALHSGAAPIVQGVRSMARAAPGAAIDAAQAVGQAVKNGSAAVADTVRSVAGAEKPTPGTMASGGAAGTDIAAQRIALGQQMDVPVNLTKGQASRDFEQQRFERETQKDPSAAGQMLRDHAADQNGAVQRNFDVWVDQTGAEAPDLRGAGQKVVGALQADARQGKDEIRAAYKKAENAGELEAPVTLASVVDHLNEDAPAAATAPVLDAARKFAVKLGIATEGEDGTLTANPVPLKRAEMFRQAVGRATDYEPTNVRQSSIIKGAIDTDTDGLGGALYQQARRMRSNFANRYENNAVIAKLMGNKRGTNDRQVAFEDVWKHAIDSGSLDDVRKVRSVLQTGGEDGQQAWRELQGRTIAHLKEAATQNAQMDVRGQPVVSPAGLNKAIKGLDQDGKLDFIFGKRGAQKLRDVNELTQVMFTAPAGSVNSSNTASVIMAALTEAGVTGAVTGLPIPVISAFKAAKNYRDRSVLRARVQDALDGGRNTSSLRPKP